MGYNLSMGRRRKRRQKIRPLYVKPENARKIARKLLKMQRDRDSAADARSFSADPKHRKISDSPAQPERQASPTSWASNDQPDGSGIVMPTSGHAYG